MVAKLISVILCIGQVIGQVICQSASSAIFC